MWYLFLVQLRTQPPTLSEPWTTVYNYFTIVILNPKRFYNKWKNKEVLYFTSFYSSDNSKIALRTGWNEAKDRIWSKSQKFILWNQQYSRKNKQEERKSYKETERETERERDGIYFHFYEFYSGSQHLSHGKWNNFNTADNILFHQNSSEHKFRIQRKANLKMYCISKNQFFCFYLILCKLKMMRILFLKTFGHGE